jgi:hypothetical protein
MSTPRSTTGGGQGGFAGGIEVIPFAVLVFVLSTVLMANAWAVLDAKLAVEAAAREATRAYVESGASARAEAAGTAAARTAFESSGRNSSDLNIRHSATEYVRCASVHVEVSYLVRAVPIPIIQGFSRDITVVGRHREVIDPFAAGFGTENRCGF